MRKGNEPQNGSNMNKITKWGHQPGARPPLPFNDGHQPATTGSGPKNPPSQPSGVPKNPKSG